MRIMSTYPFDETLTQIETLIIQGLNTKASLRIKSIATSEVPIDRVSQFANLARRCGEFSIALKLLNPIIRSEKLLTHRKPTNSELCAYASTLVMIGATDEANKIFFTIDPNDLPDVLLFQSMGLIANWKYGSAIPVLRRFLSKVDPTEYSFWIATTNLAAALVVRRQHREAHETISKLLEICKQRGYNLLLSNALVLAAQSKFDQNDFTGARQILLEASEVGSISSLYKSLIQKWLVIIDLQKLKDKADAVEKALSFRQSSMSMGFWENVRDIDFHIAKSTRDTKLFYGVYHGSFFTSYKRKIKEEFNPQQPSPSEIQFSHDITKVNKIFNLDSFLQTNDTVSHFVKILLKDHYQPFRLGQLFNSLYPDEFYNPFSSPHRIEQVVYRLRKKIAAQDLGFSITSNSKALKIAPLPGISLEYSAKSIKKDTLKESPSWLDKLQKIFSVNDVVLLTGCSKRSAQRSINQSIQENRVVKKGKGKATYYLRSGGMSQE